MPAAIISGTSCLILLDKIESLHILRDLFGEVISTHAVVSEFGQMLPEWIKLQDPLDKGKQEILKVTVDHGEASAIALALELEGSLLIIDELKGRRLARQLGITITGTLGILVQAKRRGYYKELKPVLERIQQTDFRLSQR